MTVGTPVVLVAALCTAACTLTAGAGGGDDPDASAPGDAAPGDPDAAPGDPDAGPDDRDPRMGDLLTYSFDRWDERDVRDRSGNGFTGDLEGTSGRTVEAVHGDAIDLDGGYVFVPKHPSLVAGPPLTFEAWVRRDTDDTPDTLWSDRDDALTPSATLDIGMLAAPGGIRVATNDDCVAEIEIVGDARVPASVWTHVAVVWDGVEVRFYLDAELADTVPLDASPCVASSDHIRIGEELDGDGPHRGELDDVKLSSYAKTAAQLAASMTYDLSGVPSLCGDLVLEGAEECDADVTCCDRATCRFVADDTPCGAGSCQAGVCTGGGRVSDGLIAAYEFDEGSGDVVGDSSGVSPAIDLTIADPANVTWGSGTLSIDTATILESAGAATRLTTACQATGEVTVEAWVDPDNITQDGPARIVTLSTDTSSRNFALAQNDDLAVGRVRSALSQDNGTPNLHPRRGDLAAAPTHLVLTFDSGGMRALYVDGLPRAVDRIGADTSTWDSGYSLAIANELTGNRAWLGVIDRVAIYDRALTAEEVGGNFAAGP